MKKDKQVGGTVRGPFVSRAGGKRLLVPRLAAMVPAGVMCVVEAFGGGGAFTLMRARAAGQVAVYNDLDGELSNCFRQVREHGPEVRRCLAGMINSRRDFVALRDRDLATLTEVQRAARCVYLNKLSFGGGNQSFGVVTMPCRGAANSLERAGAAIEAAGAALDGVIVENLPWERLRAAYDRPHTWWLLDPPYVGGGQKSYRSWSVEEWAVFAGQVRTLRGGWVVTAGEHDAIRELFADCEIEVWDRANHIGAAKKGEMGKRYRELIISPKVGG